MKVEFRVFDIDDKKYRYNVQLIIDGQCTRKGKFCRNLEEVKEYMKENR